MLFSNFFIHSRHFIRPNKLLVKQMQEPNESFTNWLYRYLVVRLHFIILLVYSGISTQLDMLQCEHNAPIESQIVHDLCLFNYTYAIRDDINQKSDPTTFENVLRPGVTGETRYFRYYPHIFLILAVLLFFNIIANTFLAGFLYFQQKIFTCRHGCCVKIKSPVCYQRISPERLECQIRRMTHFMTYPPTKWLLYASYICAEIPPMLAIIASVSFLNFAFDYKFLSLGWDLVNDRNAPWGSVKSLRYIFPVLAKCQIHFISSSGELLQFDSFCLLWYNYLNQGTFVFLWFLYAILFVAFALRLLFKLTVLASPTIRQYLICHMLDIGQTQRRVLSIAEYILLVNARAWNKQIITKAIGILLKSNKYLAWVAENESKAKSARLFKMMSRKYLAWEEDEKKERGKSKLIGRVPFPFSEEEMTKLLNTLTREPRSQRSFLGFSVVGD